MDITPDPRLLKMLGEIEFEEWQCLAELIDNSFDSFLKLDKAGVRPGPGGWQVAIELPSVGDEHPAVKISDNGPGMSREQLNNAVRAGFSSNDRYTNLGLFGMGFNVSTARLGDVTTISTQRATDLMGSQVSIDFNDLVATRSFDAKELTFEKEFPHDHGTSIEISSLKPERASYLQRNAQSISQKLGMIYSHLILEKGFKITVQGKEVLPHRHCIWSKERQGEAAFSSGTQKVPAIMEINKELSPLLTCLDCGDQRSIGSDPGICYLCGSPNVEERARRITGWLGVQRYLHPSEFGIDFLRNGRKILTWDKKLFDWRNPNDPNSTTEVEYPSELAHQGGRIVGEIHIDHVPVSYTKDNFEYSDKEWRFMVEYLRGVGPMRQIKAKQAGYEENMTPLAQLVRAFAKNNPGTKYLVPGDGTQAIHVDSREWGRKFREDDPAFQTDEKWWEAASNHDRIQADKASGGASETQNGGSVFDDLPSPGDSKLSKGSSGQTKVSLIDEVESMVKVSVRAETMSGMFQIDNDKAVELETYRLPPNFKYTKDRRDFAIQISASSGNKFTTFINGGHPLFVQAGLEPGEMVLMRLSALIAKRFQNMDEDLVAEKLADGGFAGLGFSLADLQGQVRDVVSKITNDYAVANEHQLENIIRHLKKSDEQAIIDAFSSRNGGRSPDFTNPEILAYLTPTLLLQLLENYPESFLNGKVFAFKSDSRQSESSRRLVKWKLLQDLIPLVAFIESTRDRSPVELNRLRDHLDAISAELA